VKVEEDKEGGYDEVAYGGTRGDRKPEIPNELTEGHLTVIPIKELRAGDEVHGLHHRHWKEPRTVEQVERWTGANVHVYWKRPKDRPIWLDVLSPNKMALIKCRSIKEDTPISMTVPKSGLIIEEAIGLRDGDTVYGIGKYRWKRPRVVTKVRRAPHGSIYVHWDYPGGEDLWVDALCPDHLILKKLRSTELVDKQTQSIDASNLVIGDVIYGVNGVPWGTVYKITYVNRVRNGTEAPPGIKLSLINLETEEKTESTISPSCTALIRTRLHSGHTEMKQACDLKVGDVIVGTQNHKWIYPRIVTEIESVSKEEITVSFRNEASGSESYFTFLRDDILDARKEEDKIMSDTTLVEKIEAILREHSNELEMSLAHELESYLGDAGSEAVIEITSSIEDLVTQISSDVEKRQIILDTIKCLRSIAENLEEHV
jgi:hypothetical protein